MRHVWHRKTSDYSIDTHVIVHNSLKKPEWLEQCIESLERNPTNIMLTYSSSHNLGEIRYQSFLKCNEKYLSFVDDDDYLEGENAFEPLITFLEEHSDVVGCYTDFTAINAETEKVMYRTRKKEWSPVLHMNSIFEVLHLKVFRREATFSVMENIRTWPTLEEALLVGILTEYGTWQKLNLNQYVKRSHSSGASGYIDIGMINRVKEIIRPALEKIKS